MKKFFAKTINTSAKISHVESEVQVIQYTRTKMVIQ